MEIEFKVSVVSYGEGRNLMLSWRDPFTRKRPTKSAGTTNRREAERKAAILEKELREGKFSKAIKITWQDFTFRYADDVFPGLAVKTRRQLLTVFNTIERLINPNRLADVTAERLSYVAGEMRREGKSAFTVKNYLAHLKAAMRWAHEIGLLQIFPQFPKVQGTKQAKGKSMKGRPISTEEFERMITAVPKVVGDRAAPSWRRFLEGLWLSGLRLSESLALYWDRPDKISVDLSGKFPMLRIPGALQKSGKTQLYPVAPEFGRMLLSVPPKERRGRVFKLLSSLEDPSTLRPGLRPPPSTVSNSDCASRIVTKIGKEALVVVSTETKTDRETGKPIVVVKYASAHDLRRSFGFRWSRRVASFVLKELMRHASISTTEEFYVGQNAESTAQVLWDAAPDNTFDNTSPSNKGEETGNQETAKAVNPCGITAF